MKTEHSPVDGVTVIDVKFSQSEFDSLIRQLHLESMNLHLDNQLDRLSLFRLWSDIGIEAPAEEVAMGPMERRMKRGTDLTSSHGD